MTVGRPCVEREHRAKHAESYECANKQCVLPVEVYAVLCNLNKVHRMACVIVDAEDADKKQCRAAHKHKGQLHRSIVLVAAAPHSDEKIHRDERNLIEHEHCEQVNRDEEAEHSG